ncbi:MAG TPA: S41 family peptidase [Gemmatimonadaceae bacterium]
MHLVGLLLLWPACLTAQVTRPAMPDSVREYVRTAMELFRQRSVHRDSVDWTALEDSVLARAANAQVPADTWLALSWAFRSVDRHSFLQPPMDRIGQMLGVAAPEIPRRAPRVPTSQHLAGGIGLVTVPGHGGPNRPEYVDSLQTQLARLDSAGVCGWVVDLRENTGGNMWPMLAGLGPLLGGEVVGSFSPGEPEAAWRYREGRSWYGDSIMPAEPVGWGRVRPRDLEHADAPVALLLGKQTASSGEMVVIAFQGRPNTRSFGDSTAGFASANSTVPLRDGAMLVVTSSYPRDRHGRAYPLRLGPDELVPSSEGVSADAPLARAVTWLRDEQACRGRQ